MFSIVAMPPGTRFLLAVALASAATLTLSASAHAWDVETIATAPPSAVGGLGGGHAALSGTGDLAVAWTEYRYPQRRGVSGMTYQEKLLTRTPGAAGEVVELPVARDLLADAASLLAIDTRTGPGTLLSVRPAGGAFGAFEQVAPTGAGVITSRGGARLVDYEEPGQRFTVRVALPGRLLGAPEDIGTEGSSGGPAYAVADSGEAVLVWTRYVGGASPYNEVVARVRSAGAGGTWGPATTLGRGSYPQLSMNAEGDTLVAWQGTAATGAAYRPAGGAFGTAFTASKPYGTGSPHQPRAGIGPDGRGMVLTVKYQDGGLQPIERVDVVDGAAQAPGVVADDARAQLGRLEVDAQGTAWLVHAIAGDGVAVRRAAAGGAFGPATTLTGPGEHVSLSGTDLDTDGRGGAAVTWEGGFDDAPKRIALATEGIAVPTDDREVPSDPPLGGGGNGQPNPPVGPPAGGAQPQVQPAPAKVATVRALAVRTKGGRRSLSLSLDVPSSLRIVVQRSASGRRAGKACVRATKKNRRKASCTRWVRVGRPATVAGAAGANAVKVALPTKAGRYRVTVTPAGGKATTVAFRVTAKKRGKKR